MESSEILQNLGSIGEFVGGVLIIATLMYLAIQTRQSAKVGYWQMYTAGSTAFASFFLEVAKDAELQRIWTLVRQADSSQISAEDRQRCSSVFESFLINAESSFFMNTEFSRTAKTTHERWDEVFRFYMSRPLALELWERQKFARTLEFREFVDQTRQE